MNGAAKALARTDETVRLTGVIRHPEERFRALFEGAAIGIGICNLDGHILESNAALAKLLGYSREELSGVDARELHPGDFQPDETLLEELKRGTRDSFKQESQYLRKDGSYLWGQMTVSAVHDVGGEPAFLIAMLEDATEARRVAEKSREAEKMEVIGRLAGGIAHDFNNLLTWHPAVLRSAFGRHREWKPAVAACGRNPSRGRAGSGSDAATVGHRPPTGAAAAAHSAQRWGVLHGIPVEPVEGWTD